MVFAKSLDQQESEVEEAAANLLYTREAAMEELAKVQGIVTRLENDVKNGVRFEENKNVFFRVNRSVQNFSKNMTIISVTLLSSASFVASVGQWSTIFSTFTKYPKLAQHAANMRVGIKEIFPEFRGFGNLGQLMLVPSLAAFTISFIIDKLGNGFVVLTETQKEEMTASLAILKNQILNYRKILAAFDQTVEQNTLSTEQPSAQ